MSILDEYQNQDYHPPKIGSNGEQHNQHYKHFALKNGYHGATVPRKPFPNIVSTLSRDNKLQNQSIQGIEQLRYFER